MHRRTLLSAVGTGLAASVAGCIGSDGDGPGAGDGTENGTDGATPGTSPNGSTDAPTDTETATDAPPTEADTETGSGSDTPDDGTEGTTGESGDAETTFEVTDSGCGGSAGEATVSADDGVVTVEGLIRGSDGCHTARLADESVEDGTLTVAVETYVPESEQGKACIDCLLDIEYVATVTVEETPESVVVEHDGEQVAETAP